MGRSGSSSRTTSSALGGAIALITKLQVLPFWAASLTLPLLILAVLGRWRSAGLFAGGLVGSVLLSYVWLGLISQLSISTPPLVSGLHAAVGMVFDPFRRFVTLKTLLHVGLPTLFGLLWFGVGQVRIKDAFHSHLNLVRLAYNVLVASWFAWWALTSVGWSRYLFPPTFLTSVFVAAMFHEWSAGFQFTAWSREFVGAVMRGRLNRRHLRFVTALVLVVWSVIGTAKAMTTAFLVKEPTPLAQTVKYLDANVSRDAVIETYESELFFFLKGRYHYPPDQVHVQLIRRADLGESVPIDYDPLKADPEYLVVGNWCKYYRCYDDVLSKEQFRLIQSYGNYKIYRRVRAGGV